LLCRFHEAGAPVWSLRERWTETADPNMGELLGAICGFQVSLGGR
jgi:hypothetical protein